MIDNLDQRCAECDGTYTPGFDGRWGLCRKCEESLKAEQDTE